MEHSPISSLSISLHIKYFYIIISLLHLLLLLYLVQKVNLHILIFYCSKSFVFPSSYVELYFLCRSLLSSHHFLISSFFLYFLSFFRRKFYNPISIFLEFLAAFVDSSKVFSAKTNQIPIVWNRTVIALYSTNRTVIKLSFILLLILCRTFLQKGYTRKLEEEVLQSCSGHPHFNPCSHLIPIFDCADPPLFAEVLLTNTLKGYADLFITDWDCLAKSHFASPELVRVLRPSDWTNGADFKKELKEVIYWDQLRQFVM